MIKLKKMKAVKFVFLVVLFMATFETHAQKELSKKEATKVVNAYLKVKDALVKSNTTRAAEASIEMWLALKQMKEVAVENLVKDAKNISEASTVERQREYFNSMSNNVVQLVKKYGKEGTFHVQKCPMAFDNTGAIWLSAQKEVLNPYFGDKMLHCGKVIETL